MAGERFIATVDNIAALKAFIVGDVHNVVWVRGHTTVGDGGEGEFRYNAASAAADNNGTIIAPTIGSGRWIRQYAGPISVRWFGAQADAVTDDTTAIQAAIDIIEANGGQLIFPPGTYVFGGTQAGVNPTIGTVFPVVATLPIRLTGYGATLRLKSGLGWGNDAGTLWILGRWFSLQGDNITFEGFTIDGNHAGTILKGVADEQSLGLAIQINGASRNVAIRDVNIVDTYHDGIYVSDVVVGSERISSSNPLNLIVENVSVTGAGRNGMTVVGGGQISVRNLTAIDSGVDATLSLGSGNGFRLETNDTQTAWNVKLDGLYAIGNQDWGLALSGDRGQSSNVLVSNSTIWGTGTARAAQLTMRGATYLNCNFFGGVESIATDNVGEVRKNARVVFIGCRFEDLPHSSYTVFRDPSASGANPNVGMVQIRASGAEANSTQILFDSCTFRTFQTQMAFFSNVGNRLGVLLRNCHFNFNYSTGSSRPVADILGVSMEHCWFEGLLGTVLAGTGTVSVTAKGTALTGVGTQFLTDIGAGALTTKWVRVGDEIVQVTNVADDTNATITTYTGASQTALGFDVYTTGTYVDGLINVNAGSQNFIAIGDGNRIDSPIRLAVNEAASTFPQGYVPNYLPDSAGHPNLDFPERGVWVYSYKDTLYSRSGDDWIKNLSPKVLATASASYVATAADDSVKQADFLIIMTNAGARDVTLPASPLIGQEYIIKDGNGNAGTNNITIQGNGKNIDGAATNVIAANFGSRHLRFVAGVWYVIGS